jgi:hypothetical protein
MRSIKVLLKIIMMGGGWAFAVSGEASFCEPWKQANQSYGLLQQFLKDPDKKDQLKQEAQTSFFCIALETHFEKTHCHLKPYLQKELAADLHRRIAHEMKKEKIPFCPVILSNLESFFKQDWQKKKTEIHPASLVINPQKDEKQRRDAPPLQSSMKLEIPFGSPGS